MKTKTIIALALFSALSSSLLACGGCVDAPAAAAGARTINTSFDAGDTALSGAFQNQINLVQATLESELKNQKEYNTIVNFEIDTIVNLKALNFLKEIETAIRSKE